MIQSVAGRSYQEQGARFDRAAARALYDEVVLEQFPCIYSAVEHPCGCVDKRVTREIETMYGPPVHQILMERTDPCEIHTSTFSGARA